MTVISQPALACSVVWRPLTAPFGTTAGPIVSEGQP